MFIKMISSRLSKKITSLLRFQFTILLNQYYKKIFIDNLNIYLKTKGQSYKPSNNVKQKLERLIK